MDDIQTQLAEISKEFKAKLKDDPDNGGPIVDMEYYDTLADFKPYYQTIPNDTLINKARRKFYRLLSSG